MVIIIFHNLNFDWLHNDFILHLNKKLRVFYDFTIRSFQLLALFGLSCCWSSDNMFFQIKTRSVHFHAENFPLPFI